MSTSSRTLRRGLPRVPGGEPWPPPSAVEAPAAADERSMAAGAEAAAGLPAVAEPRALDDARVLDEQHPVNDRADASRSVPRTDDRIHLRRGLPRVAGGEPWPPAGLAPRAPHAGARGGEPAASVPAPMLGDVPSRAGGGPSSPPSALPPLPFPRTVWAGAAADGPRGPVPEPRRLGPFTLVQWTGALIVGGGGLLVAAAMAVLLARWLVSIEPLQDFLVAYPGQYDLREGAPVGLPAWLGWQHFFNAFLIVLIIRSGLQVRRETRPSIFWSPRRNKKRKISLSLWTHQALDVLWVLNGVIFVVMLFATGQWMRIVPTSWEVVPNAVSAGLQYLSLDWPTENGWAGYNSLQQLAYFATVFVAAPLAVVTGVRMSGIWPKNAATLNRLYPVEWARRVHFPVMLYFVAFIVVHVALVFATGALRNLNHMYAAQDAVNWTGFWIFAASMLAIAAGWVAARPLVLVPIARLFGTVKGR